MRILIKRALIVDPLSKHHNKKKDLFIRNGRIEKIGRSLDLKSDRIVKHSGLCVSPGWCDIGTQIGEPGFEHRENVQSVGRAATAGGYTLLACFPNTLPVIDNRSSAEYVINRSETSSVRIIPIGSVTTHADGKQITELQDLHMAGAVAFSDGRKSIETASMMMLALDYVKTFDGLVINRPFDSELVPEGQMHEALISTSLGMRGFPRISEKIVLERDIRLLEYTGSRLHVFGVSSGDSVGLVKSARKADLNISCSVAVQNLLFTDTNLKEFETNFKVLPPLREEKDRKSLIAGIADGTISCIVSNHEPLEKERKSLEFAHADFGSTGLQTAFGIANRALSPKVELEQLINCLTHGPREALGLPECIIEEGIEADLTLFDPTEEWIPTEKDLLSKSKNSAAIGISLLGRAKGTIVRGSLHTS